MKDLKAILTGLFRKPAPAAPVASETPVLVFLPPLVTVLTAAERAKGAPLTESEVLEIRDRATVMAVRAADAAVAAARRGYADIVAEDAWREWQRHRAARSP
ncbi:MAG: hypothetical protein AB7U46_12965 [Paenirhodobacter sp.]|uniref:hypothetical protein n=1 Tax=Paenirhodobacter sp. TaxID=1965326 RepID=UPI003D111CC6